MRVFFDIDSSSFAVVKAWSEFQKSIGKAPEDFGVKEFIRAELAIHLDQRVRELRAELESQGVDWRAGHQFIRDWHVRQLRQP